MPKGKPKSSKGICSSLSFFGGGGQQKGVTKGTGRANLQVINDLFQRYEDQEDESPGAIGMQGISQLGDDVGINSAEDVRILVFLWKIGANEAPGQIQKLEWENGLEALGLDSIDNIREYIHQLDPSKLDHHTFREFYRFVFQFSREGTKRTIEKDIICALLPLALAGRSPHLERFVQFLDQLNPTTRITLDQWNSFLEFSLQIPLSLEGFDSDGAWPTLLDEYVEWVQTQQNGQT